MTLREKVIVETYTGICMVTGEEREEIYKYWAELMGRPVYTHELASKEIQEELKAKSKDDFIALCKNSVETALDEPKDSRWIPCSERMPEDGQDVLVWFEYFRYGEYNGLYQTHGIGWAWRGEWSGFVNGQSGWHKLRIIAWRPLPEEYRPVAEA